jgi:hypothetical protein
MTTTVTSPKDCVASRCFSIVRDDSDDVCDIDDRMVVDINNLIIIQQQLTKQ